MRHLEKFLAAALPSGVRIAFLGLPLAACLLHADGHELVYAGLSRTDVPGTWRLRRRLGRRVRVRPKLDRALVDHLAGLAPDLVVSWFWTNKIPMDVVRTARFGGVGVHPSLLPRHRGPDPTTWAILADDTETGVTAHRLEAEYDTGAILGQERIAIDPAWNAWDLARALDRPSLRLLRSVCAAFARGEPPAEQPQDASQATDAPFLNDDAQTIRWSETTSSIVRLVRALAPSPGAVTELAGELVTVLRVEPAPAPSWLEVPGEAAAHRGRCLVRTRDGAVVLAAIELAGRPLASDEIAAWVERSTIA